MKPHRLFASSAAFRWIRLLASATRRAAHTHRRLTVPVVALLALWLADHSSRPVKNAPGRPGDPAASPAAFVLGPSRFPDLATPAELIGIHAGLLNPREHRTHLQQKAMLAQAAAADQARMLRVRQIRRQRDSGLRANEPPEGDIMAEGIPR